MKLERIGKYYYRRFQRLKGNPHALAGGFAIGIFVGITPTMPFHTIAIILLTLLTRTSTVSGILSSWIICNPLTYFPIYYFSLKTGNAITAYDLNWEKIKAALDLLLNSESFSASVDTVMGLGYEALIVMLAGGTVLALPFTIVSYYLSKYFFVKFTKKRMEKRILH